VRFVGEAVAVVVAGTRAEADDACALVSVEYAPHHALIDPEAALDARARPLFRDHGSNCVFARDLGAGDRGTGDGDGVAGSVAAAGLVVRQRMHNPRVASVPMECDGVLARYEAGRLTVWASTQRVHHVRDAIASSLAMDPAAVRVIAPQVGGGFGGKFEPSPEAVVVAAVARATGQAVLWTQTRTENLLCMPHGRGQHQHVTVGLDGALLVGIDVDIVADAGAYPMVGALVPNATLSMIAGPYRWRDVTGRCRVAATNTTPVGAFRGAGRPEATAAIERTIDIVAADAGIDPLELRRTNLVGADELPYTSATGMRYDSGDYRRCLDEVAARISYPALRDEQRRRRASGETRLLGIGLAVWLDCTPMNRPGELAIVRVERTADAPGYAVEVRDGANDQGQAHQSTWAILLTGALGVAADRVRLHGGDTAHVAHGEGTGSARSLQLAGNAVHQAGHDVLQLARQRAADLLEASPDDVVHHRDGRFAVQGAPARSLTWADLVADAPISATVDFVQPGPTYPSGAHAAVVEVDLETGNVTLRRFAAVDDCGTVINPTVVEGQQHGGIAQGIAQALYEAVGHAPSGDPVTTSFADYLVPSAADLCGFEASTIGIPSPINPLGAKGIGQAGAIGATPAVQNAVVDAVRHLGVRHIDLPLTPERVWRAILGAHE
jgi:carbon-monoxide dehydrogenase large subunit